MIFIEKFLLVYTDKEFRHQVYSWVTFISIYFPRDESDLHTGLSVTNVWNLNYPIFQI